MSCPHQLWLQCRLSPASFSLPLDDRPPRSHLGPDQMTLGAWPSVWAERGRTARGVSLFLSLALLSSSHSSVKVCHAFTNASSFWETLSWMTGTSSPYIYPLLAMHSESRCQSFTAYPLGYFGLGGCSSFPF